MVPLWFILVCKIPQFWAKATDSDSSSYFSRSRHTEVTENSYYVLSPKGEPKKVISSWTNSDYLNKVAKIKEQANQRISI